MKIIRTLVGIGLAALTDAAMGIIIIHIMGKAFGCDVPNYFYLVGIFLSLLPDLDIFLVMMGLVDDHHKLVTHYPIPIIVFSCFILEFISIFWPTFHYWTAVVSLCFLSHYLDDTIGRTTQLGLKWTAPFGKKYYALLPRRVLTEGEAKKMLLLNWRDWLEKYYLRLTPESAFGGILFIGAVLLWGFW